MDLWLYQERLILQICESLVASVMVITTSTSESLVKSKVVNSISEFLVTPLLLILWINH